MLYTTVKIIILFLFLFMKKQNEEKSSWLLDRILKKCSSGVSNQESLMQQVVQVPLEYQLETPEYQ